jgi:hypothetical protein
MNKFVELTLDEWYDQFKPEEKQYDDPPLHVDYHYAWTAMDGDEGQFCVGSGIHWVNRLHYYVTAVPWEDDTTYDVVDDDEDSYEDEEEE